MRTATTLLLLLTIGPTLLASDESLLTVDRLIDDADLRQDGFGPYRWLDGRRYTMLEEADDGRDLVAWDAETGDRQVLVAAAQLVPDGSDKPLRISDYSWSGDHEKLLIFTNHASGVAPPHARRLLGPRPVDRRSLAARPWLRRGTAHVRQVLARRDPRRLRLPKRRLRRATRRRRDHPGDTGRVGHADPRHVRLGVRGGVRVARRLPVEPRRRADRVLGARQLGHRRVRHHRQHQRALPDADHGPLPEGRYDELGVPHRRHLESRR